MAHAIPSPASFMSDTSTQETLQLSPPMSEDYGRSRYASFLRLLISGASLDNLILEVWAEVLRRRNWDELSQPALRASLSETSISHLSRPSSKTLALESRISSSNPADRLLASESATATLDIDAHLTYNDDVLIDEPLVPVPVKVGRIKLRLTFKGRGSSVLQSGTEVSSFNDEK